MIPERLQENLVVLRESITQFKYTGCLWSSSKYAARALTHQLKEDRKPMRILEVGPGAGPVTVEILDRMQVGDSLTICEINPNFMAILKKRLQNDEGYIRHADRVEFFTGPVQDLPEDQQFDIIVCALPFLNFDLTTVKEIFAKFRRLCTESGEMNYFEYMGLRNLSKVISPPKRKMRMNEIDGYISEIQKANQIGCRKVWKNLLPINVYTLDLAA